MWHDEICHQLLAKGALLIKDAQVLYSVAYSDFISATVPWKRTYGPLYIPFHLCFDVCKYFSVNIIFISQKKRMCKVPCNISVNSIVK
jgi:hypothetical protein